MGWKKKTEPPTKAVSGNLLMLPKTIKRSSKVSCRMLVLLWPRWGCFNLTTGQVGKINRQSIHRTKWVRLCRAFSSLVLKIEQLQGWDTGLMEYVTVQLIEQFKWVYCEQHHLLQILQDRYLSFIYICRYFFFIYSKIVDIMTVVDEFRLSTL